MIVLHVMQGDMVLEAASTAHAVATAPPVGTPQRPISLAPLQTTAWRVLLGNMSTRLGARLRLNVSLAMRGDTVQAAALTAHAVATVQPVDTQQWPISLAPLQTTAYPVMLEDMVREAASTAHALMTVRWVGTPQWLTSLGLQQMTV